MSELLAYAKLALHRRGYVSAQIELTSRCFQRCLSCFAKDADNKADWSLSDAKRLFNELATLPSFEHLTLTGGDPQAYAYLEDLLYHWDVVLGRPFRISMSTALMVIPSPLTARLGMVRLSLDALSPEVYKLCRGVERDPKELVNLLVGIGCPCSALTCLSINNLDEMLPLADYLVDQALRNPRFKNFKRWSVVPMLGATDEETEKLMEVYHSLECHMIKVRSIYPSLPFVSALGTNRLKDFYHHRKYAKDYPKIPCWSSYISCHIKADMKVYPCCLIGGEATAFSKGAVIGDLAVESLTNVYTRWTNSAIERHPQMSMHDCARCREVCQIKQHSFNEEAEGVSNYLLSMP